MLTALKHYAKYSWYGCLVFTALDAGAATPSLQGQSGYVNMPSAWTEADSTISAGYGYDSPYGSAWVSATLLPFLQVTGRYVSITGLPAFGNRTPEYGKNYGRYKDKVADVKLRLLQESAWTPEVAVGATDLFGTELFRGHYLVASKVFGAARNIEASIGVGRGRPDGLYAGVRWVPLRSPNWAFVAEYDANDYRSDHQAERSGAAERSKGPVVGLEYRWGWLGAQIARHRDHFSANAFVSIPFNEREFIPKLYEPAYFRPTSAPVRVSAREWHDDSRHGAALVQELARQNYRNVRVEFDAGVLKLVLTNNRISNMGRAVGRATRTALAFAPEGTRAIHVTYSRFEQPVATYEFFDLPRLSDYLTGLVDREAFMQTVVVRYATPADRIAVNEKGLLNAIRDDGGVQIQVGQDGDMVRLSAEDREANRFRLAPKVAFFFNDPSGALRYDLSAAVTYDKRLAPGTYLNAALRASVLENISDVTQKSNSLLPHVRTDIAEYKRGNRVKLNRLMLNKYMMLDERLYARASVGLYEEMFRGIGGQVLYLPKDARWAVDFAADAVQQRGFGGWFDRRDYSTVTALGSLHYRLPYDVTATVRAGRFLARDDGARLEFKRRFASGMELGFWYTKTNGRDITSPGTPANPYNDKGVFLSLPLSLMLPVDTQASAGMALGPWTRDVGQMVASPGDLYGLMEQPRRNLTSHDGLGNFAERPDEQTLAAVNPPVRAMPSPWPAFRWRLEQSVSTTPTLPQWARGALFAGGAVAAGALADEPVDRFVSRHAGASVARGWGNAGKLAPVLLTGAAGAAVAFGDARMQNIGLISLQSVAGSLGVSAVTKRLVARARPDEELGPWSRTGRRSDASFPSNHSAAAFAAVTPFAKEYDAPWLYGVAALGAAGRVADRKHWVSDVAAGGIVGYAVGSWLWQAQRDNPRSQLSVVPRAKEVSVSWSRSY
ncbi:YjbH domain-containing protein [Massilia sp. SYSU DXS3249]